MTLQNEPMFSPLGYAGMTLSVSQQRQLLDTASGARVWRRPG
jgi:hypothetical protein